MEHTKGPWSIGEDSDVFTSDNSACIATICGAPEGIKEALANARLIAAAPTLLKACKMVLMLMEREDEEEQYEIETTVLRDAIQEAKGGD